MIELRIYKKFPENLTIEKNRKRAEQIELTCPVCKQKFLFRKSNLSTRPNPCCSKRCGGIKSHWKK